MAKIYRPVSTCVPSRDGRTAYVYKVIPTARNGLAAITSANELLLLDRQELAASPVLRLQDVPANVSALVSGDDSGSTVLVSGSDGTVAGFDVRSQTRISHFKTDRPVTALAGKNSYVAVGTELSHHQAVVSIWDRRQNRQQWQNAENNDDITALDFHPSQNNILLAGGDDGQISIFDTLVADEDDSLFQGVSHGPIHKAGFIGDQRFFALTSDQSLAIHSLSSPGDEEDPQPTLLGDLRPLVPCEYVIDVFRSGDGYAVATGTNNVDPKVMICELKHATNLTETPKLNMDDAYRLDGAHGEEIVRSLFVDDATGTIFTAGEDGCINAFQYTSANAGSAPSKKSTKSSKAKQGTDGRYKPY